MEKEELDKEKNHLHNKKYENVNLTSDISDYYNDTYNLNNQYQKYSENCKEKQQHDKIFKEISYNKQRSNFCENKKCLEEWDYEFDSYYEDYNRETYNTPFPFKHCNKVGCHMTFYEDKNGWCCNGCNKYFCEDHIFDPDILCYCSELCKNKILKKKYQLRNREFKL